MVAQHLVRLGLWVFGDFYETDDPKNGHREIAKTIISQRGWEGQYEVSKFNDPVDFLVFVKEAIKIGNCYCQNVITLSDGTKGREVDNVLVIYEKERWRIENIRNPYLR